jgi:Undecaprenyl-phosphate glucose phosphotransferase
MIRKHQRFFNTTLEVFDALMLTVAYAAAYFCRWGDTPLSQENFLYLTAPLWTIPFLICVYFWMEVYTPMRGRPFRREATIILRAHVVGITFIHGVFYVLDLHHFSREVLIAFSIFGLLLLLLERSFVRWALSYVRSRGYNQKHVLVLGTGETGLGVARKLLLHRDFGYNLVGFLDNDTAKHGMEILGRPVLGGDSQLPEFLDGRGIDEVIGALPLGDCGRYPAVVAACEKAGVRLRIVPDFSSFLPGQPIVEEFDGIPLMNIRNVPLDDPLNRLLKRCLDMTVAATAIIVTAPLMLVIAAAIKMTSRGPVLFAQERIGLNNRPFRMLKFRSMALSDNSVAATTWTTANDPRRTKFGSFLRKTSLDELPQFFNVLLGSMSVVGPRPEREFFVEQFKEQVPKYMVKHQVLPGITGWAQVNGWRGDSSIEKRIECDIYYIENWQLLFDLKIILLTIARGFVNRNAY